jgi:D-lyxose ketol-isomerase
VTSSRTNVSGMKTGHHDETRPTQDLFVSLGAKPGNSLCLLRGLWHSKLEQSDLLIILKVNVTVSWDDTLCS